MRSAERGGWEERTPLNRQAATKQEIHDRPAGDKGITIGDREVQIESAFNFCTEFDQVEGVAPLLGHRLRRLGYASGDIPRSARKESSSRTFDGEMPKCRATRAFTWFSNMLLIYRESYRARLSVVPDPRTPGNNFLSCQPLVWRVRPPRRQIVPDRLRHDSERCRGNCRHCLHFHLHYRASQPPSTGMIAP